MASRDDGDDKEKVNDNREKRPGGHSSKDFEQEHGQSFDDSDEERESSPEQSTSQRHSQNQSEVPDSTSEVGTSSRQNLDSRILSEPYRTYAERNRGLDLSSEKHGKDGALDLTSRKAGMLPSSTVHCDSLVSESMMLGSKEKKTRYQSSNENDAVSSSTPQHSILLEILLRRPTTYDMNVSGTGTGDLMPDIPVTTQSTASHTVPINEMNPRLSSPIQHAWSVGQLPPPTSNITIPRTHWLLHLRASAAASSSVTPNVLMRHTRTQSMPLEQPPIPVRHRLPSSELLRPNLPAGDIVSSVEVDMQPQNRQSRPNLASGENRMHNFVQDLQSPSEVMRSGIQSRVERMQPFRLDFHTRIDPRRPNIQSGSEQMLSFSLNVQSRSELIQPNLPSQSVQLQPDIPSQSELAQASRSNVQSQSQLMAPNLQSASELMPPILQRENELMPPYIQTESEFLPPNLQAESERMPPNLQSQSELPHTSRLLLQCSNDLMQASQPILQLSSELSQRTRSNLLDESQPSTSSGYSLQPTSAAILRTQEAQRRLALEKQKVEPSSTPPEKRAKKQSSGPQRARKNSTRGRMPSDNATQTSPVQTSSAEGGLGRGIEAPIGDQQQNTESHANISTQVVRDDNTTEDKNSENSSAMNIVVVEGEVNPAEMRRSFASDSSNESLNLQPTPEAVRRNQEIYLKLELEKNTTGASSLSPQHRAKRPSSVPQRARNNSIRGRMHSAEVRSDLTPSGDGAVGRALGEQSGIQARHESLDRYSSINLDQEINATPSLNPSTERDSASGRSDILSHYDSREQDPTVDTGFETNNESNEIPQELAVDQEVESVRGSAESHSNILNPNAETDIPDERRNSENQSATDSAAVEDVVSPVEMKRSFTNDDHTCSGNDMFEFWEDIFIEFDSMDAFQF